MKVGQSLWINIATEHLGRHKSQGKYLRAAFHSSSSSLALWQQPAKQDPSITAPPSPPALSTLLWKEGCRLVLGCRYRSSAFLPSSAGGPGKPAQMGPWPFCIQSRAPLLSSAGLLISKTRVVLSLERASASPGNLKAARESRPSAQPALQGASLGCFLSPSWAPAGALLVRSHRRDT